MRVNVSYTVNGEKLFKCIDVLSNDRHKVMAELKKQHGKGAEIIILRSRTANTGTEGRLE